MRNKLLTAIAAAAILSCGIAGAAAAPIAPPSASSAANARVVEKAAIVCGYYGCVRVRPRYYRGYYGYYYRPYRYWYGPRRYWW